MSSKNKLAHCNFCRSVDLHLLKVESEQSILCLDEFFFLGNPNKIDCKTTAWSIFLMKYYVQTYHRENNSKAI